MSSKQRSSDRPPSRAPPRPSSRAAASAQDTELQVPARSPRVHRNERSPRLGHGELDGRNDNVGAAVTKRTAFLGAVNGIACLLLVILALFICVIVALVQVNNLKSELNELSSGSSIGDSSASEGESVPLATFTELKEELTVAQLKISALEGALGNVTGTESSHNAAQAIEIESLRGAVATLNATAGQVQRSVLLGRTEGRLMNYDAGNNCQVRSFGGGVTFTLNGDCMGTLHVPEGVALLSFWIRGGVGICGSCLFTLIVKDDNGIENYYPRVEFYDGGGDGELGSWNKDAAYFRFVETSVSGGTKFKFSSGMYCASWVLAVAYDGAFSESYNGAIGELKLSDLADVRNDLSLNAGDVLQFNGSEWISNSVPSSAVLQYDADATANTAIVSSIGSAVTVTRRLGEFIVDIPSDSHLLSIRFYGDGSDMIGGEMKITFRGLPETTAATTAIGLSRHSDMFMPAVSIWTWGTGKLLPIEVGGMVLEYSSSGEHELELHFAAGVSASGGFCVVMSF